MKHLRWSLHALLEMLPRRVSTGIGGIGGIGGF